MSKDWEKEFIKCPCCGENKPFFKGIVDNLKKAGRVPKEWNFWLDMRQGVVFPPNKLQTLPIGAVIPGYQFSTDICSECGCIYVIRLASVDARTSLAPATMPPGGAKGLQLPPNMGNIRGN